MAVAPDPQARVLLPFLALFVLPLTSCAFLLFALFSGLLDIRSLLLGRALCSSFPLRCLLYSRFSRLVRAGSFYPLRLFSCFASLLPGDILGFSFAYSHYPVFCCTCGFAGFCFSCPPLFVGHIRPTSASLSLLLGLPFREPALVGSSSRVLSESLSHAMWLLFPVLGVSPASGFAPSAATLLHPALLVAVPSLRFFSVVGQLALLAAPLVCAASLFAVSAVVRFLFDALPFSSLWSLPA